MIMAANSHLIFFLLLTLYAIIAASAQQGFVSIDCGSTSSSYTDTMGITWYGDDSYIYTGEKKVVLTTINSSQAMNTLRVFSTRKKNCYSIPFIKDKKVLVRASFFYGNYDQKSSPPSFDLQFDGNNWVTVQTFSDSTSYYEIIYVLSKDFISVCLAKTQPNQFPFISALEVRTLTSKMYPHADSNRALSVINRFAFGAAQDIIRYEDDPYDRIWQGVQPSAYNSVPNDVTGIDTTNLTEVPPSIVLENAIESNTSSIILDTTGLPTMEVPVYINLYFSEVNLLDPTQNRSFNLEIDNVPTTYPNINPIIPPYQDAIEVIIFNPNASSKTVFSLVSTSDSALPPLINALEVIQITDPLTNGTNSDDVLHLSLLKTLFPVLASWTGDPCLPSPYTWDWVDCTSDASPRITALYLNGFGLYGTIPDFSSMVALETIDLHNNSLTGDIPASLGNLPNLQKLVSGNRILCATDREACQNSDSLTSTPSTSSSKSSSKLPIILGVTIPAFILFLVIVAIVAIRCHNNKAAAFDTSNTGQKPSNPPQEEKMPAASDEQLPGLNIQHAANDVRAEIARHDMAAELSNLMDQHALQHQPI